jgi:uncharacterized protein DUF6515
MEVDMEMFKGGWRSALAAVAMLAGVAGAGSAYATRPGEHEWRGEHHPTREWHDNRYHHDHYYPARGIFIEVLPPHPVVAVHGGVHFFFSGGVWYRPEGPRFVVVAPPVGVVIPTLPPYYTTVYVRGVPYYYANDVYYVPSASGYTVVEPPPANVVVEQPPAPPAQTAAADQVFIYPRQGQSPEQQASDRYACHQWAVSQTGADPTLNGASVPPQKRADYQRALSACLDGRGYTVR